MTNKNKSFGQIPLALGEFVVLETFAPTLKDVKEQKTASGIIIQSTEPDFSKTIPRYAKVVSKGSLVPDSEISLGDYVVYPNGLCNGIEDPTLIDLETSEIEKSNKRRQFCYTNWKNLGAKLISVTE